MMHNLEKEVEKDVINLNKIAPKTLKAPEGVDRKEATQPGERSVKKPKHRSPFFPVDSDEEQAAVDKERIGYDVEEKTVVATSSNQGGSREIHVTGGTIRVVGDITGKGTFEDLTMDEDV